MPRGMTVAQKAEIAKRECNVAIFVEVALSPAVYVWTGVGSAAVAGKTWLGLGEFAAIDGLESNRARKAGALNLSLIGIPTSAITGSIMAETRSVQYQNKSVKIHYGFCDLVTGKPKATLGLLEVWSGFADVMMFSVGDTFSATLTCDHFSSRMSRANGLRMSSESHNARLGNPATKDLFFEPQNRLMGRAKPVMK